MGREARCVGRWRGGSGEVKALLETHELILRGSLKGMFPIAGLRKVRVEGDDLIFVSGEQEIALGLGADVAARWARKIATPPLTLREKLGIGASAKAWVIGKVTDEALAEALRGATTGRAREAAICSSVVSANTELATALDAYDRHDPGYAIWIVYRKGPGSAFGEGAARRIMRERGFMDNKVAAVSAELSATRYARKRQD